MQEDLIVLAITVIDLGSSPTMNVIVCIECQKVMWKLNYLDVCKLLNLVILTTIMK